MRTIYLMPLAAAILLAGCGSADTDGDGTISAEEAAAEAANGSVVQRPGQYKVTYELLDFRIPNVPDDARQRVRDAVANGLGGGSFECVTAQDVADGGAAKMIEDLAKSDCTMTAFDVSGATFSATAQCSQRQGATRVVDMEGTMTAESSTATLVVTEDVPDVGTATTTIRANAERFGECAG